MSSVVVIGAGHNALVAATLLARAGLQVTVCEAAEVLGGAARTEHPFPKVPGLGQSTGAYLLGLMPPELMATLDLELPLLRRDPHYFLPTLGSEYLLVGRDGPQGELFGPADRAADARLQAELAQLRTDLAPAWLAEPLDVEATAERYIRPSLRDPFVRLVTGSVAEYLDRFGFASELAVAMYATTDGLSGLHAGPDTPGSGHNFLVHNMCRIPEADGTWLIVRGGMGSVTGALADLARGAGVTLHTDMRVTAVVTAGGSPDTPDARRVTGVQVSRGLRGGTRAADELTADVVVAGCDPWQLANLVPLPGDLTQRLDRIRRTGTTLKVNLALGALPSFRCLPADTPTPFGATIHLLPQDAPMAAIRTMWRDVQAGRLPAIPTIEWYVHTTVDPTLQDPDGHHSAALFVQSVPYEPAGSSWPVELDGYVRQLLAICDAFAPGTSGLVVDTLALPPPAIEARFGMSGGHIHHVDNTVAFDQRMPYRTGVDGLYAASAGCHPAGSVIGAAGYNAARRILADLGTPVR